MNIRKLSKRVATGLAILPLLGSTCVEDKIVDLILTASAVAEFQARGQINVHDDTDTYDLKQEVDLEGVLAQADVSANDLDPDAVKVSRIFYKVVIGEAGRSITNGSLTVSRGGGAPAILVQNFSASMAAPTDWLDITDLLGAPGVAMLNDFLADCIAELQGGPTVTDSEFTYTVSGNSVSTIDPNPPSNFDWAVKIQFQGKIPKELSLPNF